MHSHRSAQLLSRSSITFGALGLTGFIASTLVRRLLAVGHTVHAADIGIAMPRMASLRASPGGKERLKAFQVACSAVLC